MSTEPHAVAVAHTRGGGEFCADWHHAGRLAAKQNVLDDFAACARFLVESHLTTSEQLAIIGGSNGGLLMGAMLTQHPGLSRAVVAMVPVMDMLRVELARNGTFNVGEYGTVNVPALRVFDVIAWMEGRKKEHGLQASKASR